jgi:phage terminase large subunit
VYDLGDGNPTKSTIQFFGLDDIEKIKSTEFNLIWMEEATGFSYEDFTFLQTRLSAPKPEGWERNQIVLSLNPGDARGWIRTQLLPQEGVALIESTYKDNPFLNSEYVAALDEMATRNPAKYRVFGLGLWGTNPEGLVIKHWRTEEFDAMALAASGLERRCGMDIGWIDKTAILDTLYDREQHIIYVFNEFYKSGCQLNELAAAIKDMNIAKSKIRVDSAEPRTIQYLRNEGINAEGATKGKDSVRSGLMFLQDNLIIVHPKCQNFITELENFSYIKSKITGEYTEDTYFLSS